MSAIDPDRNHLDRTEHSEVLGNLGLAQLEQIDEITDGGFPGAEGVQ